MTPMTAPTGLRAVPAPLVGGEGEVVEPQPDQGKEQPHPAEWYDTPEFRRQLLEHFQKACRTAVASNPPGMPG